MSVLSFFRLHFDESLMTDAEVLTVLEALKAFRRGAGRFPVSREEFVLRFPQVGGVVVTE